ncbi:MAG: DUF4097 family beta strand repeat-containing protein [Gemmatimonadota bacterium]
MLLTILSTLLLAIPSPAQDTLVSLAAGDRLVLGDISGFVAVSSWEEDALKIRTDRLDDTEIQILRHGNRLELRLLDRKGRVRPMDLDLRVPAWMGLEMSGRDLEVDIRDLEGEVKVRSLDGDLFFRNLSGRLEAASVQGSIEARGLHGVARLRTGHDDVTVDGASGSLSIETISGDLELQDMAAMVLEARTTSGDVDFQGRFSREGEYTFRSHDGDLTLSIQEPVELDVSVLVYSGEFHSDFPVRAESFRSGRALRFTLGDGGGSLMLETFDGDIEIRRRR